MAINTGSYPKALVMGVKGWWGSEEDSRHAPIYPKLFQKVSSDQSYEEYVQTLGTGIAPQKNEGQGVQYGNMQQGYSTRVTNIAYALGLIFTHEEITDNKYPKLAKQRVIGLRDSFRETREINHANIFNRAFTAGFKGGDGVSLCSSSHVSSLGYTNANQPTVATDLSEKALEDMLILIMQAKDDKGFFQRLSGDKLQIAPANAFIATRILKSATQSGNANGDVNAVREMGLLKGGVVLNPYLTSPMAWFVTTDIRAGEGLITQEREALSLKEDNEYDTMNYKVMAYERYAPFWVNFRSVYGSNGP